MRQSEVEVVVPLRAAGDTAVAGGKAAALARAIGAGHRVPDGLVIPVAAVGELDGDTPWLAGLVERLGGPVAVRSSAIDEDSAEASYAGQYTSVLSVADDAALVEAVRTCRDSARSGAVHQYAEHAHADGDGSSIAVLVQSMVPATTAGVAFSIDPVTGDDHVVIEATRGLGDALLGGEVTGERWTVAGDEASCQATSDVLTVEQALEVSTLCRDLSDEWRGPVDIEWAFDGDELWLLQVRPVTVVPVEPVIDVPDGQTFARDPRVGAPLTPLSYSCWLPFHSAAFTHTFERFGMPLTTIDNRHLYGRVYSRAVPVMDRGKDGPPPPAPIMRLLFALAPPMRRRARDAARWNDERSIHRLIDDWDQRGRAWTHERTTELRERELTELDDLALADHLDDVLAHVLRVAEDHFDLAIGALYIPMGRLGMFVEERLGWSMHEIFTLVQGYGDASRAHGDALRQLVAELGPDGVDAVTAAPSTLLDHAAGRRYLDAWGHRVHLDLSRPTEAEHPALVAAHLRRHAAATERADGDPTLAARDAEARARAQLAGDADRSRFDELLALARRGRPLGDETEGTVLDAVSLCRYVALEAGRRFERSARLRSSSDVFFLEQAELSAMLRSTTVTAPDIVRRRGELLWCAAHPAPEHVGPEPAGMLPPSAVPRRVRDSVGACLWAVTAAESGSPPPDPGDDDALRGIAGSAGVVEGPVRIVRDPNEFDRVQPGDVVVCAITQASWSPIFDVIGGLVTEQGGPLSHPGTLAREYALPCVLSVPGATARLTDGELVRLDGGAGTVTMVTD